MIKWRDTEEYAKEQMLKDQLKKEQEEKAKRRDEKIKEWFFKLLGYAVLYLIFVVLYQACVHS